ncbi:MAG: O-antigen ligase family protein [Candidatus Saccharicenans sp.]
MEQGSAYDRFFLLTIFGLAVLIATRNNFKWSELWPKNKLFFLVLGYMLLSIIWSRFPEISFRRWVKEAITLGIIALALSEDSPIKSIFSAFRRAIYIAIPISLMLIKYFPEFGRQYGRWSGEIMWVGVATQKNGLALICIFSLIFLIWSNWDYFLNWSSVPNKLLFLTDLFIMLLSFALFLGPKRTFKYSATSTISLMVGLVILFTFYYFKKKQKLINANLIKISLLLIIILGIMLPFSGKVPWTKFISFFGREATLTGRTQIWSMLVPYVWKKPFLGYGEGGFWTTALREQIESHAHNGYLDTILELGFLGLFLILIFIYASTKKFLDLAVTFNRVGIFFLCLVFMFLIHNCAESTLASLSDFPFSFIIMMSFIPKEKILNSESEYILAAD